MSRGNGETETPKTEQGLFHLKTIIMDFKVFTTSGINSPTWQYITTGNQQLLLFGSSAYGKAENNSLNLNINILSENQNWTTVGKITTYANVPNEHRTFPTYSVILSLPPHTAITIQLDPADSNTIIDGADNFSLTILDQLTTLD